MKTPQEAAREYATKKCPYYVESDCDASGDSCNRHCQWFSVSDWTERANTFLAGAKEATRWISVEDELPENEAPVIARIKTVEMEEDEIIYGVCAYIGKGIWVNQFGVVHGQPTHWRPIERVKE